MTASIEEKVQRLELLHRIGVALSAERNRDRLVETILLEAKALCHADGGTLYLVEDDALHFAMVHNDTLGIAEGGTTGRPVSLPPIPLRGPDGRPNERNVASYCAVHRRSVNIPDAYDARGFDFSGTRAFDARNAYRSRSFLTIPMVDNEGRVIGVLQLINARDPATSAIVPFDEDRQRIVEALASQAAVALDNQMLLEGQKALLESFIQLIAAAIDAKSPYTGKHCERVPILTFMLAQAACEANDGPFKDFRLTEEEWYELRIAAWLHDCGKIVTPVHVMDKATKLETIFDRIALIRARFALLEREAEIRHLQRVAAGADPVESAARRDGERFALRDDLAFLERCNIGGEFLSDEDRARIAAIGARRWRDGDVERPLLEPDEIECLSVRRGTLTDAERLIINGHMVETIKMLEALPFPRHLRRVPEYAGGHHERMDGRGYPRGLFAGDMSIPARIMAIADVFEALTAQDRPYKKGKTLSETMKIMAAMKRDNHLDPDLLDLFVTSGVYKEYARRYLPPDLIDEVDEREILETKPRPFELPPEEVRRARWGSFLPEYQTTRSSLVPELPQRSGPLGR
ncbi:MAG: GAF domain-containing protein [Myxococcota bacterium]|nr:GAF domain-containing protein [Myxococcota bacterium]MDW8363809.1 HD domain-containing phosphohydrolase [Myxococcales bacterium]